MQITPHPAAALYLSVPSGQVLKSVQATACVVIPQGEHRQLLYSCDTMSSLVDYTVALPTEKLPPETDAVAVANAFVPKFASLDQGIFDTNGIWRDVYALTGTLRTFYGASSISKAWEDTSNVIQPGPFSVNPKSRQVVDLGGRASWLQAIFTFERAGSPEATCSAIVALIPDSKGGWLIWSLRTIIEQLKGQGNVDVLEPISSEIGMANDDLNGAANGVPGPTHFECVVVGGGQAGLILGGRLKALSVNYVVLDKRNEVGDSWKTRYTSAKLHTTCEYAHLPFDRTFPAHYQEWLTKDELAQGYRDWVFKFGINVWQKSKVTSGIWDSSQKLWTLAVLQADQERLITCSQIVLAGGGGSQVPLMPEYPGRDAFEGMILHSGTYLDANEWKGKRGVIIGTANTGHDVAEDMLAAELSEVTMVHDPRHVCSPIPKWILKLKDFRHCPNLLLQEIR
jgi:thioredoxin reductase